MYQHVRNLGTALDRLFMPWYQPCESRGYSKFFDGPDSSTGYVDPDRVPQFEVTDEYLNALQRAYHQGQYDAGITNVEDTSRIVFDFLAANCITDTESAYRLGRAQKDPDPGGSVDPNYSNPSTNTPGVIAPTPAAQGDMSIVYGNGASPAGQPSQPTGGGTTPWSPQPAGGTAGPSPLSSGGSNSGFIPTAASGSPVPIAGGGINWMLIFAVAAGAWFLLKGDRS
jgi:hypothetical protein